MAITREFLKGLEIESEKIEAIMTEYGKGISASNAKIDALSKDIEKLNEEKATYESTIATLEENKGNAEKVEKELKSLKAEIEKSQKAEAERIKNENLNARFTKALGDRAFLNDFTRNGIFNEFKSAIDDKNNEGKADTDILDSIVGDKADIFASAHDVKFNPGHIEGGVDITKDAFNKMSLMDKMKLANENPAEYARLNNL